MEVRKMKDVKCLNYYGEEKIKEKKHFASFHFQNHESIILLLMFYLIYIFSNYKISIIKK